MIPNKGGTNTLSRNASLKEETKESRFLVLMPLSLAQGRVEEEEAQEEEKFISFVEVEQQEHKDTNNKKPRFLNLMPSLSFFAPPSPLSYLVWPCTVGPFPPIPLRPLSLFP